jgi:hypothetical protein
MQTFNKNNLETKAYTDNLSTHDVEFDVQRINPHVVGKIQSISNPQVKAKLAEIYSQAISNNDLETLNYIRTRSETQLSKELGF